jgi:sodium/hydrogen exchanger 3
MGGIRFLLSSVNATSIPSFDPRYFADLFNLLLLPVIIFAAGFTIKKRNFLRNFGSILTFSTLGLVISTAVIGFGLYGATVAGILPNEKEGGLSSKSPLEALLFGSLLSATDPVATLAVFAELNVEPLVYSLVFGESVLNDALAIVLYKTLESYRVAGKAVGAMGTMATSDAAAAEEVEEIFEPTSLLSMTGSFLGTSMGSALIGVLIAIASAIALKRVGVRHLETSHQMAFVFLSAYASYLLAEVLGLSGIMSLFLCGVCMSHYHWYSLSTAGKVSMLNLTGALAWLCETIVFLSIGFLIFATKDWSLKSWNPGFIFLTLILVAISRACNIMPLSACLNTRRRKRITIRHQLVLWFAGLRGAIAMILALQIDSFPARQRLINTTLIIVLATNLFAGPATKPFIKRLGIRYGDDQASNVRTLEEVLVSAPVNSGADAVVSSDEEDDDTADGSDLDSHDQLDRLADLASLDLGLDSDDYEVSASMTSTSTSTSTHAGRPPRHNRRRRNSGDSASTSSGSTPLVRHRHGTPDSTSLRDSLELGVDAGIIEAAGAPANVTARSRIHEYWRWFDDAYVKPYLGGRPRRDARSRNSSL